MNQLTTIELAKVCFDVSVDARGRESFEADSHGLESFRALCVAEEHKRLLGVGMEPALPKGTSIGASFHIDYYTADQLAAARLQDQQRIAELEAKELDLYKQLAEAKLSALNGWQRYEQANSHRKELLEAQLADRKPLTDEELYAVFPAIATYHEANKTLYRSIARAIEAAHGIGDKA